MDAETWEPLEYVEMVACPVCAAPVGQLCEWRKGEGTNAHAERIRETLVSTGIADVAAQIQSQMGGPITPVDGPVAEPHAG